MLALRPQKQIVFNSTSLSDNASKYWLPVNSSPRKIRSQPITQNWNIQIIHHIRQRVDLLARQELAFIHQHAINGLTGVLCVYFV